MIKKKKERKVLRLYMVSRTDSVGWDEYSDYVVCAYSENDAYELGKQNDLMNFWAGAEIRLISKSSLCKRGIILSSFHAG